MIASPTLFNRKHSKIILAIIVAISLLIILAPLASSQAHAQAQSNISEDILSNVAQVAGSGTGKELFPAGDTDTDIFNITNAVVRTFFLLLAVLFLGMMLYGGYNWMTAMGESEKVDKAKETIISAVIGVVIIIAGYAITTFVISNIYDASVTGGYKQQ